MTENQEKDLSTTLAALVKGVNIIQSDLKEVKTDVQFLKTDVQEIKLTLRDHSQSLNRLEAKTDTIAETVLNHEGRLTKLEKENEESRGRIH